MMATKQTNAERSAPSPAASEDDIDMESNSAKQEEAPTPVDLVELGSIQGEDTAGEEPPKPTLGAADSDPTLAEELGPAPDELGEIGGGEPAAPSLGAIEETADENPPEPFPLDELMAMEK